MDSNMYRLRGRIVEVHSNGVEIIGGIKLEDYNSIFLLLGRNLEGYRGEKLYKYGLAKDSIVTFEPGQESENRGVALKIKVESRPSLVSVIWPLLSSPLFNIITLLLAILAVFVFKSILPYVISAILLSWVLYNVEDAYKKIRDFI